MHETTASLVWLLDLHPVNRETGLIETFRLSDAGYISLPTDTPAGAIWETGLAEPPEVTQSLAAGRALGGQVESDPGTARVHRSPGRLLWTDGRRYAWRHARAVVRVGQVGASLVTFKTLLDGVVEGPPQGRDLLEFNLADASGPMDDPYLTETDQLLGMGSALRIGNAGAVQLLTNTLVQFAGGFAARFLLRPVSLGVTTWGTGKMVLLRQWDDGAARGMRLDLTPTSGFDATLALQIPGFTPSTFSIDRTWDPNRWVLVAVNYGGSPTTVQIAVGQQVLGTWNPTGNLLTVDQPLLVGTGNDADGYDLAHVQWRHGAIDTLDFPVWIEDPVPTSVGRVHHWWTFGDGAGQPQDSGPSKTHAVVPETGTVRWVHSDEGGIGQGGELRSVALGGPVENAPSRLLDPNRYRYLVSGRPGGRVLSVYSNSHELEESPRASLDWVFTTVDEAGGGMRLALADTGGRTIEAGDHLLYEVLWIEESYTGGGAAVTKLANITVQLTFADGTRTAVTGGSDQNGLSILPGTDLTPAAEESWYLRLIPLTAYVGKTIEQVEVQTAQGGATAFTTRRAEGSTRRIEITDALGALRESLWAYRDGVPELEVIETSDPSNAFTVEGPEGDWFQDGDVWFLFNDPVGTTITQDTRGDLATGAAPIEIVRALVSELGLSEDAATLDAFDLLLTELEVLGVATDDHETSNLSPTNTAIRPEQNVDEDPDNPDGDWLVADDDAQGTLFVPYFELPHGSLRPGEEHSAELLLRRSNAAVAVAPKVTVRVEQPRGTTHENLVLNTSIPMDGSGEARMSLPFSGAGLDPYQPIYLVIDGNAVSDAGGSSTVEIGAVQIRVTRRTHRVADLLEDASETYRSIVNRLLLSSGLQWRLDTQRRFTVLRLEDPDDDLGAAVPVPETDCLFTMIAGADPEYRVSLWTGSQAITAASVLQYAILWRPEPGPHPASVGVDLLFDDGSTLSESALVDHAGYAARPDADLSGAADRRWYPRRIPLAVFAGRTLERVDVVCRKPDGGSARAWLGVVELRTAGTGVLETTLWTGAETPVFVSSSNPGQTGVIEQVERGPFEGDLDLFEEDVISLVPLESDPAVWVERATYRVNHQVVAEPPSSLPVDRQLFLQKDVRVETRRRPQVLEDCPDAIDGGRVETVLVDAAEAQRLLERRGVYFGQPNRAFELTAGTEDDEKYLAALDLALVGNSCRLTYPDYGITFGEAFRIIRVRIREGQLVLTLWRPR